MSMKKTLSILTLPILSILASACDEPEEAVSTPPAGYSQYLVYIADGVWDPADTSFVPPTLEEIQRDTWQWSDAEIQQFDADAKAHFLDWFGFDIDDPSNVGRLTNYAGVVDPRAKYRAVTVAYQEVPPEGWQVQDGGFTVVIDDPDGYELGGEFAGVIVPQGTAFTYGYYQIQKDTGELLPIRFKSLIPILPSDVGDRAFVCDLWNDDFGAGEAHGSFRYSQHPDGNVSLAFHNVLTFD